MIVVSNTSPIINLAAIGHLELFGKLYKSVAIPQAVYHEITIKGSEQVGIKEVKKAKWIKVQEVTDKYLTEALKVELDEGEAEAIEAKHKNLIPKVKPLLDDLVVKAGFWMDQDLYNRVLKAAGEP